MPTQDPGSLRVGLTLTARDILITPRDLAEHVESTFLVNVVGCCEESLSTGSHGAGPGDSDPWGRVCPTPVAIGRSVAALFSSSELRDVDVINHSVSHVRELGPVLVGEPLSAIATVRFRSRTRAESHVVTIDVAVQRLNGGTRLTYELAVELKSLELNDAA